MGASYIAKGLWFVSGALLIVLAAWSASAS